MRSLVLGATGHIGTRLILECERRQHILAGTRYRQPHLDYSAVDLRDDEAVSDVIAEFQPDTVFLAAGLTQIDFAEVNPKECEDILIRGAETVARATAKANAMLVSFSTAHVFGDCPTARKEDSATAPANVFGRCASIAEQSIRQILPEKHLILRTSHVYGPEQRGRNVALSTLRKISENRTIRVAVDRTCQPTYSPDLAHAALELVSRGSTGTFHCVGPDRVSEYAFAQLLAFIHGYDSDLVQAAKTDRLGEDAPRSKTLWLDRAKVRNLLGPKAFRGPSEGLRHLRDSAESHSLSTVHAA